MNIFSRLFGAGAPVPDWASFFTPREYARFLKLVDGELTRRGLAYTIEDGVVLAPDSREELQRFGLQNLAQTCKMAGEAIEWEEMIRTHFDNLFSVRKEREALRSDVDDYAKVAHLVKLRLFPEEMPDEVRKGSVNRLIAPGIVGVLSFDLPNSVVSVSREEADRWGLADEDLIQDGLDNVWTSDPAKEEILEIGEKLKVKALVGPSFFTATHALLLEKHLGEVPHHGILVAVPHRHTLLYHPIVDETVILAVNALIPLAANLHRAGPGSISPALYWWRDGELTLLPSTIEEDRLVFTPPDDFVDMLNELCEDDENDSNEDDTNEDQER